MDQLEITECRSQDLAQRNQSVDSPPVASTRQPDHDIPPEDNVDAALPDEDGLYSCSDDDDMELSDDLNDVMKNQCRLTEGNFLTGTDCLGSAHEWTDGHERPIRCPCSNSQSYECSRCRVVVCAGCFDLLL